VELTYDLALILETTRDLIAELMQLSNSLSENLRDCTDLDTIISILQAKKTRIATLKDLTGQINTLLRIDEHGNPAVPVPEDAKLRFAELMAEFRELVEEEARIESLLAGNGLRISRRSR
jgi:hypothetical protein